MKILQNLCQQWLSVNLILCVIGFSLPNSVRATDLAALCETAAYVAAHETGVPTDVMRAITLTETGRKSDGEHRPWPWTVNMEGVGKWFATQKQAEDYVNQHFARGARSFDVGCFQVNYRWHGAAFASIREMFDPLANARYAAKFLSDLYVETGDWSLAAGAYHSRTPKYAKKYRKSFDRFRAALVDDPQDPPDIAQLQQPRVNNFPLLQQSTRSGVLGSLVGERQGARPLFEASGFGL